MLFPKIAALALMLTSTAAHGNGQTTHLWISEKAMEHLEDSVLINLLESQKEALRLGTMFPDGGYPIGHEYGEAAHWEPFQDAYRDWIQQSHPDLMHPDAAAHIAFYLGLASHGMADQVFDSMYMERSRMYDAEYGWADQSTSLDTAQDIVFAAQTHAQTIPEMWIPEHFLDLFAALGIDVDMDTMVNGQERLELALLGVGGLSEVDTTVALNVDAFPWGCSHLLDESVPGSPPFEARVVAKYWQHLWAELRGETPTFEVIGAFPTDQSLGHARSIDDVESRLSLVFNRGLFRDTVTTDHFRVEAAQTDHPVHLDLFYGDHSHVVNIAPQTDWLVDSSHRLVVTDTLTASDGRALKESFSLSFSTTPIPEEADTGDVVPTHTSSPKSGQECGCTTRQAALGWNAVLCLALAAWCRRRPLGNYLAVKASGDDS